MSKKNVNEGIIEKFVDKIFDKIKKGGLKQIEKQIFKDKELKKKVNNFNNSYEQVMKHMKDYYGEEWVKNIEKKGQEAFNKEKAERDEQHK